MTARTRLEESVALALKINAVLIAGWALTPLAWVDIVEGQYASARSRLEQAVSLQMKAGFRLGMPETLEGFARLAAAEAQPDRAVRLASAAAVLRAAMGAPLPPFWAADLERSLGAVQQVLSAEAWAAAWAAGRSMPLKQAIAEALAIERPAAAVAPGPTRSLAPDQVESLTARELEVAALVARGLTNRQIAEALSIGERTVGTHLTNILGKLGFTSRSQVAVWAVERGLVSVGRA